MQFAREASFQFHEAHRPEYEKQAKAGFNEKQQGRSNYRAAELFLSRALNGALAANHHDDVVQIASGLAEIHSDEQNYEDAAAMLEKALASDAKLGKSDFRAQLHDRYSVVLRALHKYPEATREAQAAMDLKLAQNGGKPNLWTKHSLDKVYAAQFEAGDFAAAAATAQKSLDHLHVVAPNDDHPESALTFNMLAQAQLGAGDKDAALASGKKALELYEKVYGKDNRGTLQWASWLEKEFPGK